MADTHTTEIPAPALALPQIQLAHIDTFTPYAGNAKEHPPEQVALIASSIMEFGWTWPILRRGDTVIGAGHGRLDAARLIYARGERIKMWNGYELPLDQLPWFDCSNWTETQFEAYVLADNRIAEKGKWNLPALQLSLDKLRAVEFSLPSIGFDLGDITDLFGKQKAKSIDGHTDPDAIPDFAPEVSVRGDVWVLGDHRVMCGDSTSVTDVEKLMAGRSAQLLHADPPYGMGKAADGVVGDNVYGEELDRFQMEWWATWRTFLVSNASAYIWGNAPELWSLWYAGGLGKSEPLTLRNEIVWDKKSIAGMASDALGSYPIASERALFFQLGRYVFQVGQTKDDYWPGWEPIRSWLVEQRDAAGFTNKRVGEIVENNMAGHWFGVSQWVFISADNYAKLAAAAAGKAFTKPYADLRAEYEAQLAIFRGEVRDPRREGFDAGRPFFDNAHDAMRDVWEFSRVIGAERHGHATPKPVAMMERVMRSSLRPGELCVEPFGGSGATLIGAERTGRACFTMELQPQYCDVIVRRWQAFTGRSATLAGDGRTFEEVRMKKATPSEAAPSSDVSGSA